MIRLIYLIRKNINKKKKNQSLLHIIISTWNIRMHATFQRNYISSRDILTW